MTIYHDKLHRNILKQWLYFSTWKILFSSAFIRGIGEEASETYNGVNYFQRVCGGASDNPALEQYAQKQKKIVVAKSESIRVMQRKYKKKTKKWKTGWYTR